MKVSEAITKSGITPASSYAGVETNDDYILAIKTETSQSSPKDFVVCADHISGYPAALNPTTTDTRYIRTGTGTTKTGTQRTFSIEGERCVGDAFQDYCLGHDIKFGDGQTVIVDYVWFSLRSGKGEKGRASIIVNNDADGNAGDPAGIKIDLRAVEKPVSYTYSAT